MKKKFVTIALVLSLLSFCLAGCQSDSSAADTQDEIVFDVPEITVQTCGGCEEEKECTTYTIDDVDYYVCDDCYEEFAYGMGLE